MSDQDAREPNPDLRAIRDAPGRDALRRRCERRCGPASECSMRSRSVATVSSAGASRPRHRQSGNAPVGLTYRLLTGDQHHRHATQKPVGSAGDEVGRPGPKRAERDPRFSRQPPIGGCQESCRLLMTGDDQLDRGPPKAFDDIEVLLTGPPKIRSTPRSRGPRREDPIPSCSIPAVARKVPPGQKPPYADEIFAVWARITS